MNIELTIEEKGVRRTLKVNGLPSMEYLWDLVEAIETKGAKVTAIDIMGY